MNGDNMLDLARVRTRAYFLWRNKTGRVWTDPVSNWTEALAVESGRLGRRPSVPVHSHSWPYSVHFTDVSMPEVAGADDAPEPRRFDCGAAELRSLRDAYDRIACAAAAFDYVCAFACGAVALLQWIAVAECRRLFGHGSPRSLREIEALCERLHLFPGLSWGKDSEVAFVSFLASVPPHARVMVVDCSFTGGAVAAAANAVASVEAGPRTAIHAVVDRNQLDERKLENAYRLLGERKVGPIVLQEVDSLLAEDFPELLGYDALQSESKLTPQWRPGVVVVHDVQTGRFHVRSSQPLHSVFRGLLLNEPPLSFDVEGSELNQRCADTLYFVRRHMLQQSYEALVGSAAASDPFTFNRAKGKLCDHWRRQIAAIARAFDVPADAEPPEFCASVRQERAILRGELRTVSIEPMDACVIVSVHALHEDAAGLPRIEFSFILTAAAFERAKASGSSLPCTVPPEWSDGFTAVWTRQSPDQQTELEAKWAEARDAYPPADSEPE